MRECPGHHDVRNGILCVEGLLKSWKAEGKINDQDITLAIVYLGRIEWGCRRQGWWVQFKSWLMGGKTNED